MRLLFYIEVNEIDQLPYQTEIQIWANENIDNLVVFDFDNYSDRVIVDSAVRLFNEADKIGVIVQTTGEDKEAGLIPRFLNVLLREKTKEIILFFDGEHHALKRMADAMNKDHVHFDSSMEEKQRLLINFFKA